MVYNCNENHGASGFLEETILKGMDQSCVRTLLAIRDSLDVLSGKWKIAIIGSLLFGEKGFKELQRDIDGITAKMLSKELKDLEMNKLVRRTVFDTKPVTVEYRLTEHGRSLEKIIQELVRWGQLHRETIFEKAATR